MVKTVLLNGRQTFALRGHDDSIKVIEAQPTENFGNFKALLHFRIDTGDENLELHMKTAPKNATCSSAKIQNKIIDVICCILSECLSSRPAPTAYILSSPMHISHLTY